MADRIVGQIEDRVDHVGIDGEQRHVAGAEDRGVVTVPETPSDCERRVAKLFGSRRRVLVHPVPDSHVDERDAGDLVGSPEVVQCLQRAAL